MSSYSSTVEIHVLKAGTELPPMAYILPLTALVAKAFLGVGISSIIIQVSVAGSYASTLESVPESYGCVQPPMAYIFPFNTLVEKKHLAVGMGAFVVQVFVAGSYASTVERSDPPCDEVPPMA